MNAIEIKALTKKYGKTVAVDSLDLTVKKGEFFSLLGQNGAGKTTTIKMLGCLARPTSGDAFLLGNSIISDEQKVKQIISISPQETAVAPNLTVKENLEFLAKIYGFNKKQAAQRAKDLMEKLALSEKAKEKAKTLSGGMQRRLSIAMALISDPEIIFLDEPTIGLDVRARRELWELIKSFKGQKTLVLTTHYLEEAQALSDRIAIMHAGKIKALGTTDQLLEQTKQNSLEDAFLMLTEEVQ